MKNNTIFRLLALALAVVMCLSLSVTAFAYAEDPGGEPVEPEAEESGEDVMDLSAFDFTDLLSFLAGANVTISITEDGIQVDTGVAAETEATKTGTVTTQGGRLNVRTGAGLNNTAFTQLPNGTTVEVIGQEGDWYLVRLPEKTGYVYSEYLTVTETEAVISGSGSFSFDLEDLEALLAIFGMTGSEEITPALTPDGNLNLIDDIGSTTASGKQFITVETKSGNVFYLIIDRDDEGEETVHFLNQVDEADLLALMDEDAVATTPICTCSEKCAAGAVNTACSVCATNMTECTGREVVTVTEPTEATEPEEPEKDSGSSAGALLVVLLILAGGAGAAYYFLVMKPKQGKKVPSDLDDFDLEDEEEYLNEDESEDSI